MYLDLGYGEDQKSQWRKGWRTAREQTPLSIPTNANEELETTKRKCPSLEHSTQKGSLEP